MTSVELIPVARRRLRAEAKALTVPLGASEDVAEVLAACTGKFLSQGHRVTVSVPDGDAAAVAVKAIARKVEAFYRARPDGRWRFSASKPDHPAFTMQMFDDEPDVLPGAGGLSRSEFRALALEHGVTVAFAASREAASAPAAYSFFSIRPTPSVDKRTRWAVMMLNADATANELVSFEEEVAFNLVSEHCVHAYVPAQLPGIARFKQRCQTIESVARAEAKRRDGPAIKAAALRIVEAKLRGPPALDLS